MYTFLSVLYVLVCLFLILVVLLQPGRGGIGGAFGGGSSQTVFGSSGAGNFLTRLTSVSAALFMILSATLAYMSSSSDKSLERAIEAQRAKQAAKAKDEKAKGSDKPQQGDLALPAADESLSEGANAPIELPPLEPSSPGESAQDQPAAQDRPAPAAPKPSTPTAARRAAPATPAPSAETPAPIPAAEPPAPPAAADEAPAEPAAPQ